MGLQNAPALATERNVVQTDVNTSKTTSHETVSATTACFFYKQMNQKNK